MDQSVVSEKGMVSRAGLAPIMARARATPTASATPDRVAKSLVSTGWIWAMNHIARTQAKLRQKAGEKERLRKA